MKIILISTTKIIAILIGLFSIFKGELVAEKITANEAGLLYSEVNIEKSYYDASKPFRMDAINRKLHSGENINDSRSKNRTIF